ncbi:MAG: thiamine pyrophosphate-binding protein [Candidatus Bathyarchaeota archaeon]|nr:thiamine pyrophosphate-binding protein [Candidatus Bathyarchaeota archaeon]
MKGGQIISKILKMEGTDFVPHYPYVPVMGELLDEGIRVVTTRHERTAVAMADAYTRFSMGHKNGVAMCQVGWAAHNLLGGLGQAFDDLSPMLMMPTGWTMDSLDKRVFDSTKEFVWVTKWAARLNSTGNIQDLMRMAYTRLRTGRPAPVLLEMMRDAIGGKIPDADFTYQPVTGWKYQANPRDVEVAVRALLNAKAPVFYVGDGVLQADACSELRELVDLVHVPVITSMKGKSGFPETHPLSLGMRGRALWLCMGRADLVFGIGTSMSGAFGPPVPAGKSIIICNIGEYDVNLYHKADHAVIGDAKLVLQQLIAEVKRQTNGTGRKRNTALESEIAGEKDLQMKEWMPTFTSSAKPINPYKVIWDMLQTFDTENTVITHEAGSPREQLTAVWESTVPRSYLGWGHTTNLGFSWGAAMTAKLMWPERLSVSWVGDAGMGHNAMEMETAVREELPILTVVSNNSGYAVYGPKRTSALGTIEPKMVSPSSIISYAKVAEGLGWYAERIEEPDEIIPALKRSIKEVNAGRPAMVEVITSFEPRRISTAIPDGYQPGKL